MAKLGSTNIYGDLNVTGKFRVTDVSLFTGLITFENGLSGTTGYYTSNVGIAGNLNVTGSTTFSSTITATTGIFRNLTANYLPKHTISGLINSSIFDDGSIVSIKPTGAKVRLNGGDIYLDVDGYTNGRTTISNKYGFALELKVSDLSMIYLSTSGKMGIKTTTPSYDLDVNGAARIGNSTSNGLIINNGTKSVTLTVDSNGNLKVDGNMYSTGEISAYGAGTGSTGGGTSYNRLDNWVDYGVDKAGYVLSAYLGSDLNSRLSAIEGNGATSIVVNGTGNAITSVSKNGSLITFTKDITFSQDGHTHSYLPLSGGTLSGNLSLTEGKNIMLRNSHPYLSGIGYDTYSYECMALWAENPTTSLRWHAGIDMSTMSQGTMMGITPDFEISKVSGTAKGYIAGNNIWHAGNDGTGSGLDADLLDGLHQASFLRCDSIDANDSKNAHYAIGTDSTHNFIQSHAGKPLHLNELGNYVYINNVLAATINSNVASATKLQNTRTIWGQSFNGEGNVDGTLSTRNYSTEYYTEGIRIHAGNTGGWCALMLCGKDNTGDQGTSPNSWGIFNSNTNNFYINRGGSERSTGYELCNVNGNWGIGTSSPSYKLDVNGNVNAIRFISTQATGTAPFTVSSTTLVSNLNADLLDGVHYQNILERRHSGSSASGTATGWFRIGALLDSNGDGHNCILMIKRNYNYADNESYVFSISGAYNGGISITQLSGYANSRLIDKVRIDYTNSGVSYIELHIATSTTNNSYGWTTIGQATSYTTWTAVSDTPVGTSYEFTTVNGCKSDRGFTGNIAGNASSATKLQTTRTIWGQSFNGDGNVTGDLTIPDTNTLGVAKLNTSDYSTMAFNSRAWHTAQGVNGKAFVFTTHTNTGGGGYESLIINYGESGSILLKPTGDGNVGIGTQSPSHKLDVNGTGRFTSNLIVTNSGSNRATITQTSIGDAPTDFKIGTNNADRWSITCRDSSLNYGLGFYNYGRLAFDMFIFGNTGNIGINTTTDSGYKLDVNGAARIGNSTSNGLIINNGTKSVTLTVDSNGNLKVDGNFYATGEVSAYGSGTGSTGGGGGIIQSVLGSAGLGGSYLDTDLTNTFNAYTINLINNNLTSALGRIGALETSTPNVSWGTPTSQYSPLTINSVTRNLSLDGHTHSYLPLSGGVLTGDLYLGTQSIDKTLSVRNITGPENGQLNLNPWGGLVTANGYKIWHTGNDGAGSGLDADTVDGLHSSSLFKVVLNNSTSVNDYTFWENSAGKLYGAPDAPYNYYSFLSFGQGIYQTQFNGYNNSLKFRSGNESGLTNKSWRTVAFEDSNVASATKLANTRYIWGQPFNGENDITGNLKIGSANAFGISYSPYDTNIYNYFYGGSVLNLKVGEWTASNVNVFNIETHNGGTAKRALSVMNNGFVGINTTGPAYELDVNGSFRSIGSIYTNVGVKSRNICIETDNNGNASTASSEINNFNSTLFLQQASSNNVAMCGGGGKVGIGTTSPSYKLDINGIFRSTDRGYINGDLYVGSASVDRTILTRIISSHDSGLLSLNPWGGNVTINGNTAWHAGNDGATSGLDADLLDGQHGSFYFNRNTLFHANNVDYNAVNYEIGHGVTTQPIHLPNYTGAVNAPFSSYGQMIHFDGYSFFPFRIAFDYSGRMFFQGAGYKPNGPYNYSSGTQWFEFFHSGNSNKKTVDWSAKDLTLNGSITGLSTIIRSNAYAVDSDVYGNLNWKTGAENWYNWNVGGIMCVFKSGNVMIGSTTDSGHKLNVNGVLRNIYEGDPLTGTIVSKSLAYNSSPFGLITRIYSSGVVSLQSQRESNNSETFSLSINPLGGNVGIGTTSPSFKLDVSGTARATRFVSGYDPGADNSFSCGNWFRSLGDTGWYNGTYGGGIYMADSTYVRIYNYKSLWVNGNIVATGEVTAYAASDIRLKTNIKPIMSAIDVINKLNPVQYNWNDKAKELNPLKTDSIEYGLIAQELEVVMPELVHEIYGKYKSIDYVKLVPILIKAMQEQQIKIEKLERLVKQNRCLS